MTESGNTRTRQVVLSFLALVGIDIGRCNAFSTFDTFHASSSRINRNLGGSKSEVNVNVLFAADTASIPPSPDTVDVKVVSSEEDGFLRGIGSFLVDSFWLGSAHHNEKYYGEEEPEISDLIRSSLIEEQANDLQKKFGEVLGKRSLRSCVMAAMDPQQTVVGCVTLQETLIMPRENGEGESDSSSVVVLEGTEAENVLKNAVASLGPKQRREYKGASPATIADKLLSPTNTNESRIRSACVLSNLAVSPGARNRGIAQRLCRETEARAKQEWGYTEIHLVVEEDNLSARNLYEKLGYSLLSRNERDKALRVDVESGAFTGIETPTLLLRKKFEG